MITNGITSMYNLASFLIETWLKNIIKTKKNISLAIMLKRRFLQLSITTHE
jgi:hypothetical protein